MTDRQPDKPCRNPRHEDICQEYAKCGSWTKAYANAGYSEKHANRAVQQLLSRSPHVRARGDLLRQRAVEHDMSEADFTRQLVQVVKSQKGQWLNAARLLAEVKGWGVKNSGMSRAEREAQKQRDSMRGAKQDAETVAAMRKLLVQGLANATKSDDSVSDSIDDM